MNLLDVYRGRLKMKKVIIIGHKINLRQINIDDLKILRDWRNAKGIYEFNTQFTLLNMKEQKNWFNQIHEKNSNSMMFIITNKKNQPIGVCGLIHINRTERCADVAIILGKQRLHGQGLGSEILQLLVEYGFKKLGLHRIGAEIFEYNQISVRLFEKLGFEYESTMRETLWRNGRWWNIHIFSLLNTKT